MLLGLRRFRMYGITRAKRPLFSSKPSRIYTAPSELSERSCIVVTKIRPSGALAMNRTRFSPSAAGEIVNDAGSNSENGFLPCKWISCAASLSPSFACALTDGGHHAAVHADTNTANANSARAQ